MSDNGADPSVQFNKILNRYMAEVTDIDVKTLDDAKRVVNLLRECQYALLNVNFVKYEAKFGIKLKR